jgi:putative spermidine/putrescine transport system substrate-binding protein
VPTRVALVIVAAAVAVVAATTGSAAIPKGEGALSLLEWPSYSDASIAKGFVRDTGCKIRRQDVGSSNQMAALMKSSGAKYDLVSASGDIARMLVAQRLVKPISVAAIPSEKDVLPAFRSPAFNTVSGVHYGVAVQWVPNLLLYNAKRVQPAPSSWKAIYEPAKANEGKVTLPNDPMQIADAALYLAKARPSLRIVDPFELTSPQFAAAVALLRQQRGNANYWNYAADEVGQFENGAAWIGVGWPYQALTLKTGRLPVRAVIPREGVTGFADSWMVSRKAKHPVCAQKWLAYVLTPAVQAKLSIALGETPVNPKACPLMNAVQAGSCTAYRLDRAARDLPRIRFWKTPLADCGRARARACVPYAQWQTAWAGIRG